MPNKKNGKSSAEYYRDNKESYAKKLAKQKEINKKPSEIKKRVELTKINREKGTYGNGDGKDYDHATKRMVDKSVNRGRNGSNNTPATKGDVRARGKKNKKKQKNILYIKNKLYICIVNIDNYIGDVIR